MNTSRQYDHGNTRSADRKTPCLQRNATARLFSAHDGLIPLKTRLKPLRLTMASLFLCGAFAPFSQAQAAPCVPSGDQTIYLHSNNSALAPNQANCEVASIPPVIGNSIGSAGFKVYTQGTNVRTITVENDLTTTIRGSSGIVLWNGGQNTAQSRFDASGKTINLTIIDSDGDNSGTPGDNGPKTGVDVRNGSLATIGTLNLTMLNLPRGGFYEHYGVLAGSSTIAAETNVFNGIYSRAVFDNLNINMQSTNLLLGYPLLVGIRAIQGAGTNTGQGSAGYVEVNNDLSINLDATSNDALGIYISGTEQGDIVPEVHLNDSDITIKSTSSRSAAIRLGKTNSDGVGDDVGTGLGTLYSTGDMNIDTTAMTSTSAASIVAVWEGSLLDAGASTASTTINAANAAINVSGNQDTTGAVRTEMLFNDLVVTTASNTANLVNVTSSDYLLDVHGANSNLTASAGGFLVNVTGANATQFDFADGKMTGLVNKAAASTLNMNVSNGAEWVLKTKTGTNPNTATFTQLNLSSAAQINAYGDGTGSAAFILAGNVANTGGILNLSNAAWNTAVGTVGDTLTIRGNYVGTNGMVALDTFLNDASAQLSDKLIIDGGAASGTTLLQINNTNLGAGALTTGNGILVVEAINNGTTTLDAFSLNNGAYVAAGPYAYELRRSTDPGDLGNQNWYLRSHYDCALDPIPDPAVCAGGGDVPNYRPETSLYSVLPSMFLGYSSALLDTLHERVGDEHAGARPRENESIGWTRL
ncbi:MAG: hypothetical protein LBE33_03360, partial [Zoogloeaceae bacterium]|nr:hypothetical protein [Zoogloeaceae bacterium]